MKLSLIGGLAAMVLPVAAQARSGGASARVDSTPAHVYQTDWHHGWRRHYEPPHAYYSPPVTVCPPATSYYYEEPQPYYAPDYIAPDYVPPVVVEPDYGYYGGYWGRHFHHDWDRDRGHGGEHGWHRR